MSAEADFIRSIKEFMFDDPMTAYYIKTVDGPYDPETSTSPQVITEFSCSAILLDILRSSNGLSSKFGTLILQGDKEAYVLPPEKADPLATPLTIDTTNDRIRIAGITYKVEVMKEANPTGANVLLYNFLLRR